MKPRVNYFYVLVLVLYFTACGNNANDQSVAVESPAEIEEQEEAMSDSFDATFADGMTGALFQDYLRLRTALVESDADEARAAAGELVQRLEGSDYQPARAAAELITDAENIGDQRAAFSALTENLEPLFTEGITGGTIYKQYCPMAFDGEGADWFSDSDQILNPYFGDAMLKCGKVVATIE